MRWSVQLKTLGGGRSHADVPAPSARLPPGSVPRRANAWLIRAKTGALEGPIELGSPPVEGPVTTQSGVSARFHRWPRRAVE